MNSLQEPHEKDHIVKSNIRLLVFSDDWGRHPSSCQHLISRLLSKYETTWVNTIGMRPPTLNLSTVQRALEKCSHWVHSHQQRFAAQPTALQPTVVNPRMWPWFKRSHDRQLNKYLLTKQLQSTIEAAPEPVVAITTIPIVSDLMDQLPVAAWVYYCVDDFGLWPGLDQRTMASMESAVIDKADCCIAASQVLHDRLSQSRSDVQLLTHGVDIQHWQSAEATAEDAPEHDEHYIATFWGLVDQRLDSEILQMMSEQLDGKMALVGPHDNPARELQTLTNLNFIPPVPYQELPTIAARSDVLVMPYADLPVTRAMQPLKLLEYLATGKPVVVSDLPANRAWQDCLDLARTAAEFADLVAQRSREGLPAEQKQARQRLLREDWQIKAEEFELHLLSGCRATLRSRGAVS